MLWLAKSSLRHRSSAFAASFIALFLGATMVMTFGSMLDTGTAEGVDPTSSETLTTMAGVVGGWSLLLVIFAVASTLTLGMRQRATEVALLKSVGATPGQLRRMILGETFVVALAGVAAAVPVAMLAGRQLLTLLKDTDQVAASVPYTFGPIAVGQGFGIILLSALGAALITARRVTKMKVTESLLEAATPTKKLGKGRIIFGLIFMAVGLNGGVLTATIMHGKGSDAMQTAGSASIFFAIGLALFSPTLVRWVGGLIAAPLQAFGAAGYLTLNNIRERGAQLGSALMPIILFTGIATGTLYMQEIDNDAAALAGLVKTNEQRNIETLNFVVIGMIALFACIMLINTLIASTTHRSREFGQQRLTGATPGQVTTMVTLESLVLAVTGVVFGTIASLATILPYSYARTDSWIPEGINPATYAGVIAVAFSVTLITSLATTRRTLTTPAITAVTV